MLSCDTFQAQLLDYLYDLLEEAERTALEAHLPGCSACQAALERARQQQQWLAAAARLSFPEVRFTPPTEAVTETPTETSPTTVLPLPGPASGQGRAPRRALTRWLVAAGILLALGGIGIPAAWVGREYTQARAEVEEHQSKLAQIRSDIKDNDQNLAQTNSEAATRQRELSELALQERNQIQQIQEEVRRRQVKMVIVGPQTVQAGAPTVYQVRTVNPNDVPVEAEVTARIADDRGNVGTPLPTRKVQRGLHQITVPPDQALKPGRELTLLCSASRPDEEGGASAEVQEKVRLTAPVYLTHLATDKPMYQPGEVVRFRSLTLDRASLRPAQDDLNLRFTLVSPQGGEQVILRGSTRLRKESDQVILSGPSTGKDSVPVRGVGAGEYRLPDNLPGGMYTLKVSEEQGRFPEQQRKFVVNRYQKPRFNKKLDYNRKTYGPGDEVQARFQASHARGGPVTHTALEAQVRIDGKTYDAQGKQVSDRETLRFQTDGQGEALLRFKLPAEIERGQASLTVTLQDETLVRTIPIVLKKLLVDFYPEGGDPVAGMANRVYFQVRTTLGKPAELEGELFADGKPTGVTLATLNDDEEPGVNQGMGAFTYTPRAGSRYEVHVSRPVGISQRFPLPVARPTGVVLHVPQGVIAAGAPVPVQVQRTGEQSLLVGLYCRGRLLDSRKLDRGQNKVTLEPVSGAGGVCRVTVFEEVPLAEGQQLKPVAERLIYRHPKKRVQLTLAPDKQKYVPGEKVTLSVQASDEDGKATPALVMLGVVDKRVVTLADEKTFRSMPTHFLLTTEVRNPEDLEYADFLLGSHPKAAQALDLLLGAQGWRRFAEQNPQKFREDHKKEAERLLVTIGQSRPKRTDFVQEEIRKVQEETARQRERIQEQLAKNQKARAQAFADKIKASQALQTARREVEQDQDYQAAQALVARYDRWIDRGRLLVPPLLGGILLLVGLVALSLALARETGRVRACLVTAGVCLVLIIGLVATYPFGRLLTLGDRERAELAEAGREEKARAVNHRPMDKGMVGKEMAAKAPRPQEDAAVPAEKGAPGADLANEPGRVGGEKPAGLAGAMPPPRAPAPQPVARPGPSPEGKMALDKGEAEPADRIGYLAEREKLAGGLRGRAAQNAGFEQLLRADQKYRREGGRWAPGGGALPPEFGGGGFGGEFGRFNKRFAGTGLPGPIPTLPPLVVREYAHTRLPGSTPEQRSDFTETLYWHPVLILPDGKTEVSFELCDSVTTFEVTAFAHTPNGRLGSATHTFASVLPFTLDPKIPLEVTTGDRIDLPVALANNTKSERHVDLSLTSHAGLTLLEGEENQQVAIPADRTVRKLFRFTPETQEGEATVAFRGQAHPFAADAIRRTFQVVPDGFPVIEARSEILEKAAVEEITLPDTWIKGTLQCRAEVYPSTLADLQQGLEAMLREPHGCFEQTSTSNYPNLLILDYLQETDQAMPEVERRARDLLARGYDKLTSFECRDVQNNTRRGYEWFGGTAPPHEALTAYGLMEFRDMSRVHDVDPQMVLRTRDYLLSRRDGKGGFLRNTKALDSFGRAPGPITDAYIVWALTEGSDDEDVTTELNALEEKAKTSKDPYFLSLVANALINRSRNREAIPLLDKIAQAQDKEGKVTGATTSITSSRGRTLEIETTALAVLGWLRGNPGKFNPNIQQAIRWITSQRGGRGGFGSTQSTILALKALIAFTRANKKTAEAGELRLLVNGKPALEKRFAAGEANVLTLELSEAEKFLQPGKNRFQLEVTGKNVFPYTLSCSYRTRQPASPEGCPVRLQTELKQTEVEEGKSVRLMVRVENASGSGQGMAVAIVGLPGGLIVPEDLKQLKEYTDLPEDGSRPLLDAFEINGRELVLYWRALAPDQKIEVPIDLLCKVPGIYTGPASRAYLYYDADKKHWVQPLHVQIAPRGE